jgi:hypothetical protein
VQNCIVSLPEEHVEVDVSLSVIKYCGISWRVLLAPKEREASCVARINVFTAGPVVLCTNSGCNKVERIDVRTLQHLSEIFSSALVVSKMDGSPGEGLIQ